MSLWPVGVASPCMQYIPRAGGCVNEIPPGMFFYHPELIICPKKYIQGKFRAKHFYYDQGADQYRAIFLGDLAGWPGWDARRIDFEASTGMAIGDPSKAPFVGVWGTAWTGLSVIGSYGQLWGIDPLAVFHTLNPLTMEPAAGSIAIDTRTWTGRPQYSCAVVNTMDDFFAGVSSWVVDCWEGMLTPQRVRVGRLRLPNVLGWMTYESRNYCWFVTKDGFILKADYRIPRWEMISKVQPSAEAAVGYACAFDTKRKRLAVLRMLNDAADGACRHQIEFYYPMVKPAFLTKPVPVTSKRAGRRVVLVANLVGDAGEGITPYTVDAEMVAPVEGRLVTPFSGTELGGRVSFQYQAPDEACEETIKLTTTVEEQL